MPKAKADAKVADNRLKRKGAGAGTKQSKKAAKDPNKPKRPPSAFFVFMSEFREEYKKAHPNNKSVAVVGKAGGGKWKSMSDAEKAPYVARAEKKKEEYDKSILAYNKKLKSKNEEEESDKSKSEVNDDEDDEVDYFNPDRDPLRSMERNQFQFLERDRETVLDDEDDEDDDE